MVRSRVIANQPHDCRPYPQQAQSSLETSCKAAWTLMERTVPVKGSPTELESSREKQEVHRPQDKARGSPWSCLST